MKRWGILAVALAVFLSGCGAPSDEEVVDKCPDIVKDLISDRMGDPSDFDVTETDTTAPSTEGTVTVDGASYSWWCGKGIAKTGKVNVEIRDADHGSVLNEFPDVP